MMQLFPACRGCDHSDWCRRFGCTIWNDQSRERYAGARRRAKERNDQIDRLEELLARDNT